MRFTDTRIPCERQSASRHDDFDAIAQEPDHAHIAYVRQLKLNPGTRFKQTLKGGKIILQPVPEVSTAFGALKPKRKFISIEEETRNMEKATGKEVVGKGR